MNVTPKTLCRGLTAKILKFPKEYIIRGLYYGFQIELLKGKN